jgi:hypothetical protein
MFIAFKFCFRIYHYEFQINQDGLKLNGTHQLWSNLMMLIYRAEEYLLQRKTECLPVANKVTGVEVNADKSKYIIMSQDQNAGRSHNTKIDNTDLR